ncbi:MAG: hypothetical protein CM1200mP20_03580 [Pseudomonadota bacterium]|nr:MAG: hypothetical protein CM1200mP20_03580 [Pseudomonadota bacterium]
MKKVRSQGIGSDDAITVGVQRAARADEEIKPTVGAGNGGGGEHRSGWTVHAGDAGRDPTVLDHFAGFKHQIPISKACGFHSIKWDVLLFVGSASGYHQLKSRLGICGLYCLRHR